MISFRTCLCLSTAVALGGGLVARAATPTPSLPPFDAVRDTVRGHFATEKNHQSGDVISRKQARAVLDELEQLGWKLADRSNFEKRVLDDGDFLVGQLRTPKGRTFMRKVSSMRLAYDRLDRLSTLPQGRSTIERLIAGPGGEKLIDYMSNAKGGAALAKMLSKDGAGDFDKPTGKIYTAEQLEQELAKLHEAAASSAGTR